MKFNKLYDLLIEMPAGCHWKAAYSNDPEQVNAFLSQELDDLDINLDPKTPLEGWTVENEQFALIIDLLQLNLHKGDTKYNFKEYPRPENIMAMATEQRRLDLKVFQAQQNMDDLLNPERWA